jgi:hypothetical protein
MCAISEATTPKGLYANCNQYAPLALAAAVASHDDCAHNGLINSSIRAAAIACVDHQLAFHSRRRHD